MNEKTGSKLLCVFSLDFRSLIYMREQMWVHNCIYTNTGCEQHDKNIIISKYTYITFK